MNKILLTLLLSLALPVQAQDEPAVNTEELPPASRQQSSATAPTTQVSPVKKPDEGTVIVGDREETPFGLYFTPWRNALAEQDLDRPARLLQEELLPLDEDVFIRGLEYYEALSGTLKNRQQVTPGAANTP